MRPPVGTRKTNRKSKQQQPKTNTRTRLVSTESKQSYDDMLMLAARASAAKTFANGT